MGLLTSRANLTDGELVRRVLAGDVEDFGILVERYRREWGRYAAGLCGDTDTAADAMQEAFIRAFKALKSCRDPDRFKAWFFRILTNQCHNARERGRSHVALDAVVAESERGAEDDLAASELRGAVSRALEELTKEQREAFVLKHIEGYSYVEMGEMLGEGVDALKMRVYRARETVRRKLEALVHE